MIRHSLISGIFLLTLSIHWQNNFNAAKLIAQQQHKFILLNFSGSDWCGPCIRLHKEILETPAFEHFSDSTLVLVNADFPRMKKNQLSSIQQKQNDAVADLYNSKGIFPLTLLINANGKVIKEWDGFPNISTNAFIEQIQNAIAMANP
ncbi:MAG: thioredoxin family protein [Bacteroidota bacterium]|jgi:thiol-disulfide isomerase/thioredoxin|nr:thioredoxin family protein [Bacteroidota bacterium]